MLRRVVRGLHNSRLADISNHCRGAAPKGITPRKRRVDVINARRIRLPIPTPGGRDRIGWSRRNAELGGHMDANSTILYSATATPKSCRMPIASGECREAGRPALSSGASRDGRGADGGPVLSRRYSKTGTTEDAVDGCCRFHQRCHRCSLRELRVGHWNDLRRLWHARYCPSLTPIAHSSRRRRGGGP